MHAACISFALPVELQVHLWGGCTHAPDAHSFLTSCRRSCTCGFWPSCHCTLVITRPLHTICMFRGGGRIRPHSLKEPSCPTLAPSLLPVAMPASHTHSRVPTRVLHVCVCGGRACSTPCVSLRPPPLACRSTQRAWSCAPTSHCRCTAWRSWCSTVTEPPGALQRRYVRCHVNDSTQQSLRRM